MTKPKDVVVVSLCMVAILLSVAAFAQEVQAPQVKTITEETALRIEKLQLESQIILMQLTALQARLTDKRAELSSAVDALWKELGIDDLSKWTIDLQARKATKRPEKKKE